LLHFIDCIKLFQDFLFLIVLSKKESAQVFLCVVASEKLALTHAARLKFSRWVLNAWS